ncbi:MAG: hypothetical protein IJ181_10190 [Acidaminococcaceae bacterium]|nr:hypothetical protein [Acidaminococcaceae bacterium]
MLRSEFEILTGIYVTDDLYSCIEEVYMESKEDKRVFCEKYKQNSDGLAQVIQQNACRRIMQNEKSHQKEIDTQIAIANGLQKEVDRLSKELEKEQGWEPYENSAMDDKRYEALAKVGRKMSDEEAQELIADEFGFQKDRILVLHNIGVFQQSQKKNRIRKMNAKARNPVYESTDWNYVRFNVRTKGLTWMYEMVNGDLKQWSE